MTSEDLRFVQGDARLEWGGYNWDNAVTLSATAFEVDYRPAPFDALGEREDLSEPRLSAAFTFDRQSRGAWSWDLSAAVYDGFGDFQSIWLAAYYRQQFSRLTAPAFDTWESPDPYGFAGSGNLRWEFQKAHGFLNLSLVRSRDKISPGYEIDFDGLRQGRTWLDTTALTLSWEQVVSARLRTILETVMSDTSEREIRWNARGRVFYALNDRWFLRADLGGAVEDPNFEAVFGGLTLDYSINDRWAILLSGRAYYDSGELQNDGLFSTAAPALRSYTSSLGFRYHGEEWVGRLSLGGTHSNYAEGNPDLDFFQFLYTDRDFLNVSLSFSRGF